MANSKLKKGQKVIISLPLGYTIGDYGYNIGRKLLTIEDCQNEMVTELYNDNEIILTHSEIVK